MTDLISRIAAGDKSRPDAEMDLALLQHVAIRCSELHATVAAERDRLQALNKELIEALELICSEFAQSHPLIVKGRAALLKSKGE